MVSILPFIVKQFSPSISITENISIFNVSKRKQPYYTPANGVQSGVERMICLHMTYWR